MRLAACSIAVTTPTTDKVATEPLLYVPPLVWAIQYKYSADALLLVLASDPYDPDDYVRDYDAFRALIGR